jgi:hypothetical protein
MGGRKNDDAGAGDRLCEGSGEWLAPKLIGKKTQFIMVTFTIDGNKS